MYEIVSGPMVWAAFGLFFLGLIVQGYRFFTGTHKKAQKYLPPGPPKEKKKKLKPKKKITINGTIAWASSLWLRSWGAFRGSIAGTHPLMTFVTVVFHVLLFVTPIFVLAHNTMIGWELPSFPEAFADFLTVIVLICVSIFLFRRIFFRRVRAISTWYDYAVLLITAAPFITGFLAYHQVGDYRTMIIIHMIAGEAMLVLIPFTRLGHALFFFLYRFTIGGEYSFGQGKRAW